MKLALLSFSLIVLTCRQRGAIVKSTESFDSTSFEPIIEHSQIPNDTGAEYEFFDTLQTTKCVSDSLKH